MSRLFWATLLSTMLASAAPVLVTIDTSGASGQTGTIDIQFNPGLFPAAYNAGTATITNFQITGGTLGALASGPDGGAVGALPGPLAITNSDFLNGALYNATFGSQVSFLVDFVGAAYTGTGQSILTTFYVNLLAGGGFDTTAVAELIGGSQLDTSFSSSGVTFGAPPSGTIPEVSTLGLLLTGLGALAGLRRR